MEPIIEIKDHLIALVQNSCKSKVDEYFQFCCWEMLKNFTKSWTYKHFKLFMHHNLNIPGLTLDNAY